MLLMKANFIALLFDFTAKLPEGGRYKKEEEGEGEGTVCVKMHSTQNVDKIVKTLHEKGIGRKTLEGRKTGDKAKTMHWFFQKKSHLKCQMRFVSPTSASVFATDKNNISDGILHKFCWHLPN